MDKFLVLLTISNTVSAKDSVLRGSRKLQDSFTITGECTVSDFADAVGGEDALSTILKVPISEMQDTLDQKCGAIATKDLSDTTGNGPQFLKNFLDGGTTWNNHVETNSGEYVLQDDAAVIATEYAASTSNEIYSAPDGGTEAVYERYFSNFFTSEEECGLGVIECCYTANRSKNFVGNAEMCALDLTPARQSNHISNNAYTVYDGNDPNDIYCTGFAYEAGSFGEDVKYNTLFHMAMKTNLYDKGYVRNVPGAPLCGCIEQMPIVDGADCVKAVEGYVLGSDGTVTLNITWEGCGELRNYVDTLDKTETEKLFIKEKLVEKGTCDAAAKSFMNERMYVSV